VGWPGLTVPAQLHVGALPTDVAADTHIGVLKVDLNGDDIDVDLRAAGSLKGPSAMWRLTRL